MLANNYFPRALERVARAVGAFEGVSLVPDAATRADTRRPPGVLMSLNSLPSGIVGSAPAPRFFAVAGVAAGAFEDARLDADFLGVAVVVAAGAAAAEASFAAEEEAVERRVARRGVALTGSVSLSLQPPASLAGDSGCREISKRLAYKERENKPKTGNNQEPESWDDSVS